MLLIREVHSESDAELLLECSDQDAGYHGFVAIHSTVRGPAVGGIRRLRYADRAAALDDVLRLARSMSYKSACANLPFGGGKSVIWDGDGASRSGLYRVHARVIEELNGRYIAAEDVGTTLKDVARMRRFTQFLAGDTDPAPWTARGVLRGIQAAAMHRWNSADLLGRTIALQGCGAVGAHLAQALHEAGASLIVADPDRDRVRYVTRWFRAAAVDPADLLDFKADILVPCALGGILGSDTIARLQVAVVAGAANNQLHGEEAADALARRDILYVPDYVINVGGLMTGGVDLLGWPVSELERRVDGLYDVTLAVLAEAAGRGVTPLAVADGLVAERLRVVEAPA
jgi:leucine dehydrogenase